MSHYNYKCFDCNSEFSANYIEENLIYICPSCGESKKNSPLKGVLIVNYDYEFLKGKYTWEEFRNNNSLSLWKYPYLWPLKVSNNKLDLISSELYNRMQLGSEQLLSFNLDGKAISFWDESRNPTYSFKDRATILVILKALELGIDKIAAASTGNAGSSLAGLCSRTGLKSFLFVPKNIPKAKLGQIIAYGAETIIVDGDYDLAYDISLELSNSKGWFNRNTAYNPLTIEGKKSAALDIYMSYKGNLPENIFIPVGDGVIIAGLYKGFDDLRKLGWIDTLPKLFGIQSEKSDSLVRFLETGEFRFKEASSIADSINAGAPRNLYMSEAAIKASCGRAIRVSDNSILKSQSELASKYGILAEPAASAAYSGFKYSIENSIINHESDSLILITGSGLKDNESLTKLKKIPEILNYDQIVSSITNI